MSQARTVRLTAVGVIAVYSALLALSGISASPQTKQALSYLPTVAGLIVLVFERWAWRWLGANRLFGRPDLIGTWHVRLQPSERSHIPAEKRGPRHAFMVVQQSFWTVHVTQVSAESRSESTTAALRKTDGARHQRLSFLYDNTPQQRFQPSSPRHEGACTLNVATHRPAVLEGAYFTDRLTSGDLKLTKAGTDTAVLPYEELRQRFPAPEGDAIVA